MGGRRILRRLVGEEEIETERRRDRETERQRDGETERRRDLSLCLPISPSLRLSVSSSLCLSVSLVSDSQFPSSGAIQTGEIVGSITTHLKTDSTPRSSRSADID